MSSQSVGTFKKKKLKLIIVPHGLGFEYLLTKTQSAYFFLELSV